MNVLSKYHHNVFLMAKATNARTKAREKAQKKFRATRSKRIIMRKRGRGNFNLSGKQDSRGYIKKKRQDLGLCFVRHARTSQIMLTCMWLAFPSVLHIQEPSHCEIYELTQIKGRMTLASRCKPPDKAACNCFTSLTSQFHY